MKTFWTSLLSVLGGLVFGAGVIISGMTDTAKVVGFLDVTGAWRPALAFVMGAAVLVAFGFFWWTRKRTTPLIGDALETPPQKPDARFVIGAAIFGVGWGLSGICPGPGIVWLGIDPVQILPFLIAVIAGSILAERFRAKDNS